MNKKKLFALRTIFITLTIAVMAVIFLLSADNADESNEKSDFIADSFVYRFLENFDLTDEQIEIILDKCIGIIRNTAHFLEYAALGFFLYATGLSFYIRNKINIPASFLTSALYAVSDEIHQYFVPGRSCQFTDILIDSSGALCGVLFLFVIVWIYNRRKSQKAK